MSLRHTVRGVTLKGTLGSIGAGGTADHVWGASDILLREVVPFLRERNGAAPSGTVLELGAGTGFVSILLARTGVRCIATDLPEFVRRLQWNVAANQLRHAVSCCAWDWSGETPRVDFSGVTLCLASDLVYYSETGETAATLTQGQALAATLLKVRQLCKLGARSLLLLRHRKMTVDRKGRVFLVPGEPDGTSAVSRFCSVDLPALGLRAHELPMLRRPVDESYAFIEVLPSSHTLRFTISLASVGVGVRTGLDWL